MRTTPTHTPLPQTEVGYRRKEYHHSLLWGVVVVLLWTTVYACALDEGDKWEAGGQKIGFSFQNNEEPTFTSGGTRSKGLMGERMSADETTTYDILEMKGGNEPYYLHVEETHSFPQHPSTDTLLSMVRSATRGRPVTTNDVYESFGVFAGVWNDNSSWDETKRADYMYNVAIQKNKDWKSNSYWPGARRKIRFFAYAPYQSRGMEEFPAAGGAGSPKMVYTVPPIATEQNDLLAVSSDEYPGNHSAVVPLKFNHVCTAVRFVTGDNLLPGKITKVSLKNVHNKGVYHFSNNQWQNVAGTFTFSQVTNVAVDGTPGQTITSEPATFMMIPQTLPQGAEVEVEYQLYGQTHILNAPIKGATWGMGKTVTYRVSLNSIITEEIWNVKLHNGDYSEWPVKKEGVNNLNLEVTSERIVKLKGQEVQRIPLAWKAEFSVDGGLHWGISPQWLSNLPSQAPGTQSFGLKVDAQQRLTFDDALQAAPKSNQVIDLSMVSSSQGRQTANCYIVNAAGTYKFPLVYGNAIKNGKNNSTAYEYPLSDYHSTYYTLRKFKKHDGGVIQNPYIYNSSNKNPAVSGCKVLWQDVRGLVKNVRLVGNNQEIEFTIDHIPGQLPKQGNAVIAVTGGNDNTILWSWHIWVTPINPQTNLAFLAEQGKSSYTCLEAPLGWVELERQYYKGREVRIRLTQLETAAVKEIRLFQKEFIEVSTDGRCNFYQWGRKDPFARNGVDNQRVPMYDGDGNTTSHNVVRRWATTDLALTNPLTFYAASENWNSEKYYNYWNNNISYYDSWHNNATLANNIVGVKTVYDPCPPNFMVSPIGMFNQYKDFFVSRNAMPGYIQNTNGNRIGSGNEGTLWSSESYWYGLNLQNFGNYHGLVFNYLAGNSSQGRVINKGTAFGFPVWSVKCE